MFLPRYIFPVCMRDIIIYFAQWWEKYISKCSLIKHTSLGMVSIKWKANIQISWKKLVICHPVCTNLETRHLLVILILMYFLMFVNLRSQNLCLKKCLNMMLETIDLLHYFYDVKNIWESCSQSNNHVFNGK